jgi:hypothetical protein
MMNEQTQVNMQAVEKHVEALRRGFAAWPSLAYGTPPALGDQRWTDHLILSTWHMAGTGAAPDNGLEYKIGRSGGGFDVLDFNYLPHDQWLAADTAVNLAIPLNRRGVDREIEIGVPFYGGGMSYGSVSEQVMLARARAAQAWNTFTCTGEGGYPDALVAYKEHIITQVATGMFGVREETIQYAPIVEFKYAQGAKPGLGGHLLGDKTTTAVAKMRESVPWVSLFSPFPLPLRLLRRRPPQARRLDQNHQPGGAHLRQGVHAPRRGHGRRRQLLRRGAHHSPRRRLRRHRRGARNRQEKYRHAD